MRYKGGKNGSGVYQRLISMMPPHDTYIELFLGSGAIMRRKKPALESSIAYELNDKTIAEFDAAFLADRPGVVGCSKPGNWTEYRDADGREVLALIQGDAIEAIENKFHAAAPFWFMKDPARTLIYADPPYLMETRRSKRSIYQFEMFERSEHVRMLDLLAAVPCRVMISGYDSPLYNQKLKAWRREEIPTVNRAGDRVVEVVWLNYPEPFELHDYEHLGSDFRERWRIEKKARRWSANWLAMPVQERYAILARIEAARAEKAIAEREFTDAINRRRERLAKRRHRSNDPDITSPAALPDPEQPKLV